MKLLNPKPLEDQDLEASLDKIISKLTIPRALLTNNCVSRQIQEFEHEQRQELYRQQETLRREFFLEKNFSF